jgi:threonine dehydrogenase-like Zn-dependent dehydrogenase
VVGSVNANLRHYQEAADVLAKADISWLAGLITRRVPLDSAAEAIETNQDVKVVITLNENG